MKELRTAAPTVAPADEAALVAGCRAGDSASLDRFFRAYVAVAERVIARLVGPTSDLPDLVQSTFIEAIQSFRRYRGEASLKTWVTRIAVNLSLHQLRAGVRRHVPLQLVPAPHEPADGARGADQELAARQLGRRLYDLLDRVAPKKRVAFLLYAVEGYSLDEVAALTGATRPATKSRIWFARRELLAAARRHPELRELIQTTTKARSEPWR